MKKGGAPSKNDVMEKVPGNSDDDDDHDAASYFRYNARRCRCAGRCAEKTVKEKRATVKSSVKVLKRVLAMAVRITQ
eukprot:12424143-Karenia_brevis.AAC.1